MLILTLLRSVEAAYNSIDVAHNQVIKLVYAFVSHKLRTISPMISHSIGFAVHKTVRLIFIFTESACRLS